MASGDTPRQTPRGSPALPADSTTVPPPATVDPARCPLCGGPNGCAMEAQRATGQPQPPCWCTQVNFSAALLAKVPADARDKACICVRCATGQD